MKWYKGLYMGENAAKSKYKILGRVVRNRFQIDTFLITLSDNPDNLLNMFPAYVLKQPYFKKKKNTKDIYVIGIAKGRDEGLETIRKIIDDVYQATGGFDIRTYLKFGQKNRN